MNYTLLGAIFAILYLAGMVQGFIFAKGALYSASLL